MSPRRSEKGPGLAIAIGVPKEPPRLGTPGQKPPAAEEAPAHEAAESPAQESGEDYGAKLLADIDAVGEQYGADSQTTRELTADLFEAIAKCLRGGGKSETPMPMDGAGSESDYQ